MLKNEKYYLENKKESAGDSAALAKSLSSERELNFFELFFICTVTTAMFLALFAFLF